MELADGPRAGGARGHRGTGSIPDRRAVAHSGLYSGVLSLSVSVDVVARQRHAAPTTKVWSCRRFWELRCAGGDGAGGWTSGWRGASRRVDRPATTQRKNLRIDFRVRLSLPLRPGSVGLPRQCGSIFAHWASVSTKSFHPKLESRPSLRWNPDSQQALEDEWPRADPHQERSSGVLVASAYQPTPRAQDDCVHLTSRLSSKPFDILLGKKPGAKALTVIPYCPCATPQ